MYKCSFCGNFIADYEFSNKLEFHKKDCPIRETKEVRINDEQIEREEKLYKLTKDISQLVDAKYIECPWCYNYLEWISSNKIKCENCKRIWEVSLNEI